MVLLLHARFLATCYMGAGDCVYLVTIRAYTEQALSKQQLTERTARAPEAIQAGRKGMNHRV